MTIDCERCGETFDPDREPTVPGVDTSRCPGCGAPADVDERAADGGESRPEDAEDGLPCPRCDECLSDEDARVDHLTESHDAFSDVVTGAVDAPGEVEDVTVDVEVTVTREP